MKSFIYKDIGQHGHSYTPSEPELNAPKTKPRQKPALKLHKKRAGKSVTLVRPNIA